jgi:hypothetical protein
LESIMIFSRVETATPGGNVAVAEERCYYPDCQKKFADADGHTRLRLRLRLRLSSRDPNGCKAISH